MAEKIEIEFELKFKNALKDIGKLEKELKDVQKSVKKSNTSTEKQLKAVEKTAEDSAKGVKKVSVGLKALAKGTAVIFLLQKAFDFVSGAIQENQTVMDGLNTVFDTAQIVFNQVLNAITSIYEAVSTSSEGFNALGTIIGNIITLTLTPLKLTFFAIKAALLTAQLAWEQSWFGSGDPGKIASLRAEIRGAGDDFVQVGKDAFDAGVSIVSNVKEAVNEVINIGATAVEEFSKVSITTAIETAKTNTALKKSAAIAAAESRMALERYATESEKLRQLRDDDRNSIEDRIKANNDLKEVLKNQQAEMLANVALVEAAAQAQFKLTGKDEDYIAVLDAKAERLGVISAIEGFNSEQKSNDTALTKEQIDLTKAQLESESLLSIERQRFNAELIQDELLRLTRMQEIDEIEKEQETVRLQAIVDTANAGTQAKVDAQTALDEFMETSRQTNLTRDQEIAEAEKALEEQKTADKLAALDSIIEIAGAETALGRAALIAKQLMAAKELLIDLGAIKSKATKTVVNSQLESVESGTAVAGGFAKTLALGFPAAIPGLIGYAAAAVGIVSSIASAVGKAKSVATPLGGGGGGGGNIQAPAQVPTTMPPAFNIVGSSETNQLADAIGGQSQQPVQAFVVASEVTSAQSLERNTIAGATIG